MEWLIILAILFFVVIGPSRLVQWSDRIDDFRRVLRGQRRLTAAERAKTRSARARFFLRLEKASPIGWACLIAGLGIIILDLSVLHYGTPALLVGAILLFIAPWLM